METISLVILILYLGADVSGDAIMAVEALFLLINSGVKDKGGVLKVRILILFKNSRIMFLAKKVPC